SRLARHVCRKLASVEFGSRAVFLSNRVLCEQSRQFVAETRYCFVFFGKPNASDCREPDADLGQFDRIVIDEHEGIESEVEPRRKLLDQDRLCLVAREYGDKVIFSERHSAAPQWLDGDVQIVSA